MANREKVSISHLRHPFNGNRYACISDLIAFTNAFKLDIHENHDKDLSARDKEVALWVLNNIGSGLSDFNY